MPLSQRKSQHLPRFNRGFSLVELMIALFLGTVMTGVVYQVFMSAHTANKIIDYLAQLQQTGRFAIEIIEKDLHRAGYFGGNANINEITGTTGILTPALTTCPAVGNTWGRMVEQHIFGLNDTKAGYDCIAANDYLRGDIITIRYATPWIITNYETSELYLRSSLFEGRMFLGNQSTNANNINMIHTPQTVHQLVAHSYFIGKSAETCQQISLPALFWQTLVNGAPAKQELLAGVEHLQFEYGVDLTADGTPNQYVNATNVVDWNAVVVVRVSLLVRSECPDSSYTDGKTYQIGDVTYQPKDNFHRQFFTTTITLRNLLNNS